MANVPPNPDGIGCSPATASKCQSVKCLRTGKCANREFILGSRYDAWRDEKAPHA